MLKVLQLILSVLSGGLAFLRRLHDVQSGRQQVLMENALIVNERMTYAENIRNGSDHVPDELFFPPGKRGNGGMCGLQADIYGVCAGSGSVENIACRAADKGAQPDMGEELPEFTAPERWVKKVYIHCSASDRPEHDNIEVIGKWHRARGWPEVGYHYYIDKTGRIYKGRDLEKIPAAQQHFNKGTIAICCGGEKVFSNIQIDSLKRLCRAINEVYSGNITFHGHCEVSAKTCPNFDYKTLLNLSGDGKMA